MDWTRPWHQVLDDWTGQVNELMALHGINLRSKRGVSNNGRTQVRAGQVRSGQVSLHAQNGLHNLFFCGLKGTITFYVGGTCWRVARSWLGLESESESELAGPKAAPLGRKQKQFKICRSSIMQGEKYKIPLH